MLKIARTRPHFLRQRCLLPKKYQGTIWLTQQQTNKTNRRVASLSNSYSCKTKISLRITVSSNSNPNLTLSRPASSKDISKYSSTATKKTKMGVRRGGALVGLFRASSAIQSAVSRREPSPA